MTTNGHSNLPAVHWACSACSTLNYRNLRYKELSQEERDELLLQGVTETVLCTPGPVVRCRNCGQRHATGMIEGCEMSLHNDVVRFLLLETQPIPSPINN